MNPENSLIPKDAPGAEALKTETMPLIQSISEIVVDSDGMYAVAGEELRDIATRRKALENRRLDITRPMDAAKKSVMELFATPLSLLTDAEQGLRGKMKVYADKRADEEREKARLREAAAQKERDRLREEARQAQEQGDAVTASVLDATASSVTAAVPDTPTAPKAKGITTTKRWSAEVTDKRAFIEHALKDEQYFDMVQIDMRPLNQMAVAMKDKLAIPGIKAASTDSLTVR